VHNGHLALAQACHEQAALDEVWFMPTAIQPLKQRGPHATNIQRVEMLQLAIDTEQIESGSPRPRAVGSWRVCTLEIDRGGYSYTVDTLRQLHTELPDAQLFFMIGADAVRDVPQWKEPSEIFRLSAPLVAHRAGQPDPNLDALLPLCTAQTQPRLIGVPAINVSSTEIRRRIAANETIQGMLPTAVTEYITRHNLYR
jgi:nicotinate-nucleotide adenylyltransferase